jgi:hypothetical protein
MNFIQKQYHSTLTDLVVIAKQQTFRHTIKIFRKQMGSRVICLDKFPNEQFKQTFRTTSQNGLKVSLYSSWHFSCNNLPVVFQIVFTL